MFCMFDILQASFIMHNNLKDLGIVNLDIIHSVE